MENFQITDGDGEINIILTDIRSQTLLPQPSSVMPIYCYHAL